MNYEINLKKFFNIDSFNNDSTDGFHKDVIYEDLKKIIDEFEFNDGPTKEDKIKRKLLDSGVSEEQITEDLISNAQKLEKIFGPRGK